MKVVLRHSLSGFFYGGPNCWVAEYKLARDFKTVGNAIAAGQQDEFRGMEVVACFGIPDCEWILHLDHNETAFSRGWRSGLLDANRSAEQSARTTGSPKPSPSQATPRPPSGHLVANR